MGMRLQFSQTKWRGRRGKIALKIRAPYFIKFTTVRQTIEVELFSVAHLKRKLAPLSETTSVTLIFTQRFGISRKLRV